MDSIKKQAAKLREQVAKQQHALLKHLGHFDNDAVVVDEAEFQCYQQLQKLYKSTRAAKHFQKNIVSSIESFVSVSTKQMEIARKLAEDSCKYGANNQSGGSHLAKAAIQFGSSRDLMENEREAFLGILSDKVCLPLRAMITGAPLEDARHLAHRYDKLRQEVESQGAEVLKRRSKVKDSDITAESCTRLREAEAILTDLKSTTVALGKEATVAMSSVEKQQQTLTMQKLFTLVDAERCYHQHVLSVLDKLHVELIMEENQIDESVPQEVNLPGDETGRLGYKESPSSDGVDEATEIDQKGAFFLAKVIHPFDAQAEGELSLSIDDYVIVRQVAATGWSEGECQGKAGWFPSAYVQKQEKAPALKIEEASLEEP